MLYSAFSHEISFPTVSHIYQKDHLSPKMVDISVSLHFEFSIKVLTITQCLSLNVSMLLYMEAELLNP